MDTSTRPKSEQGTMQMMLLELRVQPKQIVALTRGYPQGYPQLLESMQEETIGSPCCFDDPITERTAMIVGCLVAYMCTQMEKPSFRQLDVQQFRSFAQKALANPMSESLINFLGGKLCIVALEAHILHLCYDVCDYHSLASIKSQLERAQLDHIKAETQVVLSQCLSFMPPPSNEMDDPLDEFNYSEMNESKARVFLDGLRFTEEESNIVIRMVGSCRYGNFIKYREDVRLAAQMSPIPRDKRFRLYWAMMFMETDMLEDPEPVRIERFPLQLFNEQLKSDLVQMVRFEWSS